MPLTEPVLDDRTYRQILEEALARVPVHLPEWTNFNDADPGVTLLQLFAFMTENLLYRANRIPERNRIRFLNLLGIPRQPAVAARGMVAFSKRGGVAAQVLPSDLELTAGQVPFRTVDGLAVLPVESRVFYKSVLPPERAAQARTLYGQLFAALTGEGSELAFYETRELEPPRSGAAPPELDLADTVDGALWVALLARSPVDVAAARNALAGQVLTLGVAPAAAAAAGSARELPPGGRVAAAAQPSLTFSLPRLTGRDDLGPSGERAARFDPLDARPSGDLLSEPGVVELPLPAAGGLRLWDDLEPQDEGTGDFPPALAEDALADRLVTWIRVGIRAASGTVETGRPSGSLSWLGVNAARVVQRAHVAGEVLGRGTGEPDQALRLASTPVIPDSVALSVGGEPWSEVEDVRLAPAEVPLGGAAWGGSGGGSGSSAARAFAVDRATGAVTFGDGLRGARPAAGAVIQASYDSGGGRAGMVGIGAISKGTSLPAGVQVANPVPTWGGADAETVEEAEGRIPQTLRHRERLVSAQDFAEIARRAPGVDVGRVEVLPLFLPSAPDAPGEGVVTLMAIPRFDPLHPEAPEPDARFLETLCAYLAPRRLVTTELWVSGPVYVPVWLSVGIEVVAGRDQAGAREAVKRELRRFLSPLEGGRDGAGWPLSNPVEALELWAVAARVDGVAKVTGVLLGRGGPAPVDRIDLAGLELPRLAALSVQAGDPAALSELAGPAPSAAGPRRVPVPVVPEEC